MIGYLKGKILDSSLDGRLLVGLESGGGVVGYSVQSSKHPPVGSVVELFIHTHVREDALDLFGFATREEKELFLLLLGVNGIGPKLALGLLSKVEAGKLIRLVMAGDKAALTEIPGIGKKMAERVIVELADALRKKVDGGAFGELLSSTPRHVSQGGLAEATSQFSDAREALLGLGFREAEAAETIRKILNERPTEPAAQIVRLALKELRR